MKPHAPPTANDTARVARPETEKLLRTVIDETPYPIILKDAQGNFLLTNKALADLYNTTPEAMVGKHDDDFGVPKDMADGFRENCLAIIARGETEVVMEDSRDAVSGEIRHYRSIKKPIVDAQGQRSLLILAQDITDVVRSQQKVAESENRLQTVLRLTREGIWDWDVESGQVVHNTQWYQVLGYQEGEIPPTVDAFAELIHPDDRGAVFERLQAMLDGKTEEYLSEHRIRTPQGYIWVKDRGGIAERNADGQPSRVLGSISDITERRRRDELIAEQKRRLDLVMEAAAIGYFEWNCLTDEQQVSELYASMLGYTAAELAGKANQVFRDLVHPDDLPTSDFLMQGHLQGRSPAYACEIRMRHRAGHWVWVMARGKVTQFDPAGAPVLFTGTHQDISRIKATEELARRNEELLKSAIDTINEALVIFDPDDKLVFCNDRYRETYPLVKEIIQPGVSFETIIRTWKERGGGAPAPEGIDAWVQNRLKVHREGSVLIQPVENGRYTKVVERTTATGYVVGFRVDITDLVMAQQQAEAANVAKSRFLATMSHELRTPLNGILGMAQLLQQPDVSEHERSQFIQTIFNSGQALLTLLNDILDLSKVESGKMDLELAPFELPQLLEETHRLHASTALQKGLTLTVERQGDLSVRYVGDANRLRQMVNNLVSNAIKFTKAGSVRVEVSSVASPDGRSDLLEFAVIDTGIGIPPSKQHLLFQPFSQMDASISREFGGTGLGLSIVRSLSHLMGGDVGFESQPGQGSRFWFRVPLPALSAHGLPDARLTDGPSSAPLPESFEGEVLVVEDHPMNRMVISKMLERLGLMVHMVHDGQQAIDRLETGWRPDLVLMDVEMPILDGYSATRLIRSREAERGSPRLTIVALTANAFDADRRSAMEAGMDDFLSKPVSLPNLKRLLAHWLSVNPDPEQGLHT